MTHRFSERLRFSSRNFVSYELQPDYSYGYASSRQTGAYFFWQSDNSLGFRWTERFATYTGVRLTGTNYQDVDNNDRFTWEVYNQFRYQLSAQTVLTGDYRYADLRQWRFHGYFRPIICSLVWSTASARTPSASFAPGSSSIASMAGMIPPVLMWNSRCAPESTSNSVLSTYARYGIETYNNVQYLEGTNG